MLHTFTDNDLMATCATDNDLMVTTCGSHERRAPEGRGASAPKHHLGDERRATPVGRAGHAKLGHAKLGRRGEGNIISATSARSSKEAPARRALCFSVCLSRPRSSRSVIEVSAEVPKESLI